MKEPRRLAEAQGRSVPKICACYDTIDPRASDASVGT